MCARIVRNEDSMEGRRHRETSKKSRVLRRLLYYHHRAHAQKTPRYHGDNIKAGVVAHRSVRQCFWTQIEQ